MFGTTYRSCYLNDVVCEADNSYRHALLQALAGAGRLPQEDVTGGTLTLSNIGSIGGVLATPLVYGAEAAIVALGRIQVSVAS